jgi:hypothetical protein
MPPREVVLAEAPAEEDFSTRRMATREVDDPPRYVAHDDALGLELGDRLGHRDEILDGHTGGQGRGPFISRPRGVPTRTVGAGNRGMAVRPGDRCGPTGAL